MSSTPTEPIPAVPPPGGASGGPGAGQPADPADPVDPAERARASRRLAWTGHRLTLTLVALVAGIGIGVLVAQPGEPEEPAEVPPRVTAPPSSSSDPQPEPEAEPELSREPDRAPEPGTEVPSPGRLAAQGARIVDADGNDVRLRGVNWFGMETDTCSPHGLWQRELEDVLDQIVGFGFDTLRLPWANECLRRDPQSIDYHANPALEGLSTLELMDAVVAGARERGMRVLLDRHRPGVHAQSELWYTDQVSEQQWIDDWRMLAERYRDEPTVVGADLHNEPHGPACWGCDDPARDWAAAAERAGKAILEVNPDWLVVVEGVQVSADGFNTWWGGNLRDAATRPVVLDVPGRLVYSTHEYPQSVHGQPWFDEPAYPANLRPLWDRTWGYLMDGGTAPVLVGEFGTRYQSEADRVWLRELVAYLDEGGYSFAFWSYNPNSGDTGGLVQDDWVTPDQAKLDAIAPLLE